MGCPRADLSRVRSAAGKTGAVVRWDGVGRVQTVQVRVYAADAARLREMPGTSADAIHALLEAVDGKRRKCYNSTVRDSPFRAVAREGVN